MDTIIQILIFLFLIGFCGLACGRTLEKRHYRDIEQRERQNQGKFLVTQLKSFPALRPGGKAPKVMMSEVVIGSDYLKTWFSQWRNLFGGEMKSFRTLQDRAKREALLRMSEQAQSEGYNALCNVRFSGADVGGNTSGRKNKLHFAAIIATATAYDANVS